MLEFQKLQHCVLLSLWPWLKCQTNSMKNFIMWLKFSMGLEIFMFQSCGNPSLRLTTKVRACKVAGQEWSMGVKFYVPGSVGQCEGMNPHTCKWASTLRIKVPMDFQTFRRKLQWSKFIGLKSSLYHWKFLEVYMSKMGLHDPFGYLEHKLCQFDFQPLKVINCLDFLACRWLAKYC
jgi:hypothetical protein